MNLEGVPNIGLHMGEATHITHGAKLSYAPAYDEYKKHTRLKKCQKSYLKRGPCRALLQKMWNTTSYFVMVRLD